MPDLFRIVCAWCKLVMREGPEPMREGPEPISHGICPACAALLRGEREAFLDRRRVADRRIEARRG